MNDKIQQARELGASTVLRVGSWVWAKFDTKPAEEVRETLKASDWFWNRKRGYWQWAGCPAGGSKAKTPAVWAKYGVEEVEATA